MDAILNLHKRMIFSKERMKLSFLYVLLCWEIGIMGVESRSLKPTSSLKSELIRRSRKSVQNDSPSIVSFDQKTNLLETTHSVSAGK